MERKISKKILLSGKGRDNFPITEAEAMKKFLLNSGIAPNQILNEELSTDTIQNAYFSKVIHLDSLKVQSALIITNQFHSRRTKLIFDNVISDIVECNYSFIEDVGIEEKLLKLRESTERKLYQFYKDMFDDFGKCNIREIHDFIFNPTNKYYRIYRELGEKLKNEMVLY